jgi:hypothetical protein
MFVHLRGVTRGDKSMDAKSPKDQGSFLGLNLRLRSRDSAVREVNTEHESTASLWSGGMVVVHRTL